MFIEFKNVAQPHSEVGDEPLKEMIGEVVHWLMKIITFIFACCVFVFLFHLNFDFDSMAYISEFCAQ